jgi:hypothetical protein
MSGYNVRRESSPSLNGFHIFINLPFLAIRLYPPDAQSHPEVYMATREVAPTPQKGIRELPRAVKDRVERLFRTYLGIKMTPEGALTISRSDLFVVAGYSGCSGEPTFTANKGIVYSRTPPFENLRLHGEMACPRFRIRGARTDSERAARARRPFFASMRLRLRLRIYNKFRRMKNADRNARRD